MKTSTSTSTSAAGFSLRSFKAIQQCCCLLFLSCFGLPALGQGTMFTYQGRVSDNGTNFTGLGQFKFALVQSTNFNHQARATATLGGIVPNGFVSSVNVTDPGSGYVSAPAVTFLGGGGSGASAQANLSGGTVASVTVVSPGSGYSSTPAVQIAAPPPSLAYVSFWSNDGSSINGSEPSNPVFVTVSNGLFTIILGDTSIPNMTTIDPALFTQPDLELRIWFNDGVHGFSALSPTQRLTPAPYAIGVQGTVSATQLTGTLPATQLGGTYSGAVAFTNGSNNFSGAFGGNGGGLTNVSSGSLTLVSSNTSLTSWGANQYGQRNAPTNIQNVVSVAAGETHTLALKSDGTVLAWGAGTTNDPGDGYDFGQSIVPPGLNDVIAVSGGIAHSLALRANGTVVAWGAGLTNDGSFSQNYGQSMVPANLSNVVAISAGGPFSMALKADGTVVAWGAGKTDSGTFPDFGQSIVPPDLNNVMAIAAGDFYGMALKSNGTVVAWGDNQFGETNVPPGLTNVVAIAAGAVHALALLRDGTVVAWGAGTSNNPTDGINFGQSIVPAGLNNVVGIAAGAVNSIALKSDGTAVAWGDDQFGESSVPAGLNNILSIASGSIAYHVLAIRKQSDAPVAWLNSDNTFNGNVTVNGDTTVSGEMKAGDLRLNDGFLFLRGGNDQKNGLAWYGDSTKGFSGSFFSGEPDGPILFGEGGGALGSYGTNNRQVALVWDANKHVGIGTTAPNAPLDFGFYYDYTKLLLPGGFGIGSTNNQFLLNLNGSYGSFSFQDAPAGHELVNIQNVNVGSGTVDTWMRVYGQVFVGANAQYTVPSASENLRIVRGQVQFDGTHLAGTGWAVSHTGTGKYTITFSPAFSDVPTVVATVQHGIAQSATVSSPTTSSVFIDTWNADGTASDQYFHFIAIGPQ